MCPYCMHPIDDHNKDGRCTVEGCQFCPVIIYPGRRAPRRRTSEDAEGER